MQSSINERVKILIDSLENGVPARFAKRLGVAASVVANYLPGSMRKGSPSFDVLQLIAKTYPQINIDWVVTGEGHMMKEAAANPATPPGATHHYVGSSNNKIKVGGVTPSPEGSELTYFRQQVEDLKEEIKELKNQNKDLLARLLQYLPKQE